MTTHATTVIWLLIISAFAITAVGEANSLNPEQLCHHGTGSAYRNITVCTVAINTRSMNSLERARMLTARANAYYQIHEYASAEADFTAAIAIEDWLPSAYSGRGKTNWRLRRYDDAFRDLDKAIALFPQHATAYRYRGLVNLESRSLDEAIVDLKTAVTLAPGNAEAWTLLGIAHYLNADFDSALRAFDRAGARRYAWDFLEVWRWLTLAQLGNEPTSVPADDLVGPLRDWYRSVASHPPAHDFLTQRYSTSEASDHDIALAYYVALYLRYRGRHAQSASLIEWLREQRETHGIESRLARIPPNKVATP